MGMLLYMEELKRKEAAEKAKAEKIPFCEPLEAAEISSEPEAGENSPANKKPVKGPRKPVKRAGRGRASR